MSIRIYKAGLGRIDTDYRLGLCFETCHGNYWTFHWPCELRKYSEQLVLYPLEPHLGRRSLNEDIHKDSYYKYKFILEVETLDDFYEYFLKNYFEYLL